MQQYTTTHEWVRIEGKVAVVGISSYAQQELGEIVFVQLPHVGDTVVAGKEVAVLESTKAASDIYSPISGKVIEVNTTLQQMPQWMNRSPEDTGWVYKCTVDCPEELQSLLSPEEYAKMTQ